MTTIAAALRGAEKTLYPALRWGRWDLTVPKGSIVGLVGGKRRGARQRPSSC